MNTTTPNWKALNRHVRGWGIVRVVRTEGAIVIVHDPQQQAEYPALKSELRAIATLPRKARAIIDAALAAEAFAVRFDP